MPSTNRIAVITGGNRGLGRAAAIALADRGVDSIITYRSHSEEADAVVAEIEKRGGRGAALQLEITDVSSYDSFADSVSSLLRETWDREDFDHLVNNAGNGSRSGLAEVTEEELDVLYENHIKAPLLLTQRLADKIADGGAIVNISSTLTRVVFPKRIAYASVKAAVEVMTRYMAAELGPRGIRVNDVAPGSIATDFNDAALRDSPELQKTIIGMTALGRYGMADDIGPVIAILLGDETGFVTGQRVEASGGMQYV